MIISEEDRVPYPPNKSLSRYSMNPQGNRQVHPTIVVVDESTCCERGKFFFFSIALVAFSLLSNSALSFHTWSHFRSGVELQGLLSLPIAVRVLYFYSVNVEVLVCWVKAKKVNQFLAQIGKASNSAPLFQQAGSFVFERGLSDSLTQGESFCLQLSRLCLPS